MRRAPRLSALTVGVLFLAVYLGIEVASKEPPFRLMAPLETALAAVMLAAGCAVGPDYKAPETPLPVSWKLEAPWRDRC